MYIFSSEEILKFLSDYYKRLGIEIYAYIRFFGIEMYIPEIVI